MVIDLNSNFRIGNRLRELRLTCGLSQEQLALEANITPAYLCQVERGTRNPTVALVERLCEVLGVTLATFFSDEAGQVRGYDQVTEQLLGLLYGRSEEEKRALLQLVRCALKLREVKS